MDTEYPICMKCKEGRMLPFSDFGAFNTQNHVHAVVVEQRYKSWVCNNPNCLFVMTIEKGTVYVGKVEEKHTRQR